MSALSGLTELKQLYLSSNRVSDISALGGMTKLEKLMLGSNRISDVSALAGLANLERLRFDWNRVSDVSALADLKNLRYLQISRNHLSDVSALGGLTKLRYLNFTANRISDISALAGLKGLTELRFSDNRVADLSALAGLTKLKFIVARSQQVSQTAVAAGQAVANPVRSLDGSIVRPEDGTLCATAECTDLVYPTAGDAISTKWIAGKKVGSIAVSFNGTLTRDVTGAKKTGVQQLANTGGEAPLAFAAALQVVGSTLMFLARRRIANSAGRSAV